MNEEIRLEREKRILDTMQGKRTDRVPMMIAGDMALIRYVRPGTDFQYMIEHHEEMTQQICDEFIPKFPKMDMLAAVGMSSRHLGAAFLCKTLLPGVDIPPDEMWQLQFEDFMTEEDYDDIIDNGWAQFSARRLFDQLGYDPDEMAQGGEAGARNCQRYKDAGMPWAFSGMLSSPFDILTFSRGATNFFVDLYEIPEKVQEVMNIIMDEDEAGQRANIEKQIEESAKTGETVMWAVAPCVQANCNILSRDMFEEFGWPLIERQTNFLLDLGCYVRFHMDANWTGNLDLFTSFPKGRCIFDSDGNTDLVKTRDILGSTMAFTGTVDPARFAFGTPDAVYEECVEQLKTMGDSFILSPSCSIPANAPAENIDAFAKALDDFGNCE